MKFKLHKLYLARIVLVAGALVLFTCFAILAGHFFKGKIVSWLTSPFSQIGVAHAAGNADPEASAKAFLAAYKVFQSPRCVNCHPSGARPLQGDRERVHLMHVVRGPEGMGKNGVWCSTCHQVTNLPGKDMPPGAPGWQLPTADMPMVFQGKTPRQLCKHLLDPAQNGHRSPKEIIEHVRDSPLVIWGWHPGGGRTAAPLTHDEFVKLIAEWVEKGQACPKLEHNLSARECGRLSLRAERSNP